MTTTDSETELEIDEEIIVALSDYLDGALPADKKQEVEAKIASDATWKSAHTEMVETRKALSGLQKARPQQAERFADNVTEKINKRSAGRFFGKKTFGDRVPFGALLIVALVGLAIIAYVLWSSQTGSLKVHKDPTPTQPHPGLVDKP